MVATSKSKCLRTTNQDKKDAYTYLDLKVTATSEGVDIKGYLDSRVLTTGQTPG